ncbi:MAG: T9SS type A sorting domain-containing protein [Crocinitomicaceae bacterium]|nr:T9SS type A sorting domain-containing protein [Flavobacteriales bacterium]NQZ36241.1 T9SS type A sorting domain-containing protein [Crocinitomicaceae bacterium]
MKQLLFAVFFLFGAYSNAQDTSFTNIYEPLIGELDFSGVPVTDADIVWDEGLITSGRLGFSLAAFIARIAPDGSLMWQKQLGTSLVERDIQINEIVSTMDSSFVVVGKKRDSISGNYSPLCIKLNGSGDTLWTKSFELTNQSIGNYGIQEQRNGHIVEMRDSSLLTGFHHLSYELSASNPDHFMLTKIGLNGDVLWSKSYLTESAFHLSGIAEGVDSSIYVIGTSRNTDVYSYVVNLSSSGQFNWARKYNGIELLDIEVDSLTIYLGWANHVSESGVMKLSSTGNQIKRVIHHFPILGNLPEVSICRRSNGAIVSTTENPEFDQFGAIAEMDENLDLVSSFGVYMMMDQVVSIPSKGIYALGYGPIYGVKTGDTEMGVIRFDSIFSVPDCGYNGQTLTLADSVLTSQVLFTVSDSITFPHIPIEYQDIDFVSASECVTFLGSIDENQGTWNETISPNPSTGEFTISWDEFRDVEVVIYNSIGTEIYRTNSKNSFVEIDLQTEQNGIYYYRLIDQEGGQSNGKLIVLN